MTYEIKPNPQFKSLEVYFNEKPEAETRTALKGLHFRWNPKKGCWYGFADQAVLIEALGENTAEKALTIPEKEIINPDERYEGWQDGKRREWHSRDELKAFLKEDFKKAGLKVTIKTKGIGYLSMTFTITFKSEDIRTFEQYEEQPGFNGLVRYRNFHYQYYKEDGTLTGITDKEFEKIDNIDTMHEIAHKINEFDYNRAIESEEVNELAYTEEGNRKLNLLYEIVKSYNRDCSEVQIDYFDRDIYDFYKVKKVMA